MNRFCGLNARMLLAFIPVDQWVAAPASDLDPGEKLPSMYAFVGDAPSMYAFVGDAHDPTARIV